MTRLLIGIVALVALACPAWAQVTWSGARLAPAEAAAILARAPGLSNWTHRAYVPLAYGPTVASTGSSSEPVRIVPHGVPGPAGYINGVPVDMRDLEDYAVLSGAIGSQRPSSRRGGRR